MIDITDIRGMDIRDIWTEVPGEESGGAAVVSAVERILQGVKTGGDGALRRYTAEFDGVTVEDFQLSRNEIDEAIGLIDPELLRVMKAAAMNISDYHRHQLKSGYTLEKDGVVMGQRIIPVDTAGIYIPGGTAAYPSTLLMNVIPAKIAGVRQIYVATPPGEGGRIDPAILGAASIAGADRIFRVGGAQAIAAFCYGTESIPKVDLISGPGNIYVATAKKLLFGSVGIDMIAGPSDILVIADDGADADYLAADLLSQAEHDPLSRSILITSDSSLAERTAIRLGEQLKRLDRCETADASIRDNGRIYIAENLEQAVGLANAIAPEHLELCVRDPFLWLDRIKNAGSVFLGSYTPEALGDYFAGPNHTLPTMGTARFSSALTVDTFMKRSSFLYYTREALERDGSSVEIFAEHEGLTAHANSIRIRGKKDE